MHAFDGLEFVNRGAELSFLRDCLTRAAERPALIVLRAPAGFGKSSLTDFLSTADTMGGRVFCIVDPSIRGRAGSATVHDGFFLQRIAESLDLMANSVAVSWPSLTDFLKDRRKKSVATKDKLDIISELPSLKHAYKLLYDYTARAFSFGRFSPAKLLSSDAADAIAICSAYVEYIVKSHVVVIVLREVQHIDLHSLRSTLLHSERHPGPDLILEYTSEEGQFEPEHQKLFLRAAEKRQSIDILDLVRLGADHLEYLIRRNVRNDFDLSSDYYLSWNGNLRSIVELKFQVGISRSLTNGAQIGRALTNLSDTLTEHIGRLTSSERMTLAVVHAHVEAIDRTTLSSVLARIDPRASQTQASKSLVGLEEIHAFLARSDGAVSLRSETIALAVRDVPAMQGMLALAERALRDHYAELLETRSYGTGGFSDSVRQYFRLCAQTKDAEGLLRAIERLSSDIRRAQDQSIYIDVVASAIESDPDLYSADYDELIEWAAEIAYAICDWPRAQSLMQIKRKQDTYSLLVRACALQEIGGHNEALELVTEVRNNCKSLETRLAADLVEALITGCRGQHTNAREMLERLVDEHEYCQSPLIGYAYRFFEIVDGLESGLMRLTASIKWFERHGLIKSKAYSQLPAAMLLARSGDVEGARVMIAEATAILASEVRDQHIIFNNQCAVELLAEDPDFSACRNKLNHALRFVRDDFSELTILTNLGLAHLALNELEDAEDCADKCVSILNDHDFADTDIYWPVCFNASLIYAATKNDHKRDIVLNFPRENGRPRTDDLAYWDYRFGLIDELPASHRFLGSKSWHPVYLSHWLIDLEGLSLLKTAPPQ